MKIPGTPLTTPVLLPDWNETNERMSSFIKNKPDDKVTKGYYFKAIDLSAKKIFLSHEQVMPVEITSAQHADYYDADFPVLYKFGGKLGVVNNYEYSYGTSHVMNGLTWLPSAVIKSIDGNVITYEGDIGFGYIYQLEQSSWDSKDYSVYCLDEPDVGEVCLMVGGTILGEGNTIVGNLGFNAGKGNKVRGSYGVAVGRNLEVGYAAFATNLGNKALAQRSFASGSETQALAFASHTEGEGTIAKNVNGQHAEGRYNLPDEKGEYIHIVGGGDKVYRNNKWEIIRRNIHTINKTGRAWYADGVFVGGTSMHDAKRLATEEYSDKKAVRANLGESRSNKLFAFPADHIKLHALVNDDWIEVNDPNFHKLFTNGMQAYTGSNGVETWRPFDNAANYLGADKAVPTAWRITLTNPVRSYGDRYVNLNAACIRVHGTNTQNPVNLRVAGRQRGGAEVTCIQSFELRGNPKSNTSYFDNEASVDFGAWSSSSPATNLDTLYIYLTRNTAKDINKNFAVDEIHFFGGQTYSSDLNMVSYDHAYKVGSNGKDVSFQGKIQAQPATEDNQMVTLGQVKDAASEAVAEVVGSSKSTLDTLEELGKALGEDPNFATTMANELGKKASEENVQANFEAILSIGSWLERHDDELSEHSEMLSRHDDSISEHTERIAELEGTLDGVIDKDTSEEFGVPFIKYATESRHSDYAGQASSLIPHSFSVKSYTIKGGVNYVDVSLEPDSVYLVWMGYRMSILCTQNSYRTDSTVFSTIATEGGNGLYVFVLNKIGNTPTLQFRLKVQKANDNLAFIADTEDFDRTVGLVIIGRHPANLT